MRPLIRTLALGLLTALFPVGTALSSAAQPPDLRAKAQQGREAMAAGRFQEAASLYTEIVQALPDEPGMRLNLGMALSMSGRPREAAPHLEAALRLRPDLLPASLFLGAVQMELGRPAAAVEPLKTFVAAQPDHPEARQMLADALLALGRHTEAARHFRALSQQIPKDPRVWFGLGRSYEGWSQDALGKLQNSAPESPYVLLLIADGMASQERDKSAFPLYREALAKKPDLAEAHEGLARIYERSGHPDWAAAERAKARALPPPDCRSPSLECDFRAGRYVAVLEAARPLRTAESWFWLSRASGELAREAFVRLTELPPSPEAKLIHVQVLRAQRRYSESREALEKAAEAWPQDPRIRRELASLLFIAREFQAARPVLEALLKDEPDAPDLNLMLGEMWVEQRQPEKALPYLERAVGGDEKRLRARAVLGRAYLDAGQAERAVAHLESALESDEDGSLHFQLARAYQATGQADKARRMRQQFQEIQRANATREQGEQQEFTITPP